MRATKRPERVWDNRPTGEGLTWIIANSERLGVSWMTRLALEADEWRTLYRYEAKP